MVWAAGCPTLVALFVAIALLCPSSVGSSPLALDGREQTSRQEKGQPLHSPQQAQNGGHSAGERGVPQDQAEAARDYQVRSTSAQSRPSDSTYDGDLFKEVDAKALATILLQALKLDGEQPVSEDPKRRGGLDAYPGPPETVAVAGEAEENVRSVTRVAKPRGSDEDNGGNEDIEDSMAPRKLEKLESMFRDLERYSAATKRERSNAGQEAPMEESKENDIFRQLDAFGEAADRREGERRAQDGMAGMGRHREDARAQGPSGKEEETRDTASELLLQYLLRGEGSEEEEEEGEEKKIGSDSFTGQSASEEKRSGEDEDDGDIDPQTIDRLIEISSKLHLPADDVIDIINDVEKKRRDSIEREEIRHGGGAGGQRRKYRPDPRDSSPASRYRDQPSVSASAKRLRHRPANELTLQDLLSAENSLDYDGFGVPPPRYRPGGGQKPYPNYIRPRTYQQRHRPYYYQPVFRGEDYYEDESQDKEEELENYIEKILLKHPEVFQ